MGIAHGHARDREGPLDDEQRVVLDPVEVLPVVEGDVLGGEAGRAEADLDLEQGASEERISEGRSPAAVRKRTLGDVDGAAPGQEGGRAAQAVARDLRFAAVGVEDPEADLGRARSFRG